MYKSREIPGCVRRCFRAGRNSQSIKGDIMPFVIDSTYVWLILAVGLAILEVNTSTLVCIWFVVGSLFAFAASFITDSFIAQLVVFSIVSGVALAVTRPLAKKVLGRRPVPTNMDMLIGKICVVTEDIHPDSKGRVKVDGLLWAASSDELLKKGDHAKIRRITGATLEVEPVKVKNS